ncbi:hypothetical protein YC2023_015460 [Brassica napus]
MTDTSVVLKHFTFLRFVTVDSVSKQSYEPLCTASNHFVPLKIKSSFPQAFAFQSIEIIASNQEESQENNEVYIRPDYPVRLHPSPVRLIRPRLVKMKTHSTGAFMSFDQDYIFVVNM